MGKLWLLKEMIQTELTFYWLHRAVCLGGKLFMLHLVCYDGLDVNRTQFTVRVR